MAKAPKSDAVEAAEDVLKGEEKVEIKIPAPELRVDFTYGTEGGGGRFMMVCDAGEVEKLWDDVKAAMESKFAFDPLPITNLDLSTLRESVKTKPLHIAIDVNYKHQHANFSTYMDKDELDKRCVDIKAQLKEFISYVNKREKRGWEQQLMG